MTLKRPTRTGGGDYLDLREATENGPVLVIFRIKEFLAPEKDDFDKDTYPVRADALICSGPDKGRVYLDGVYKYAITNALRGAGRDEPTAATEIGDELVIRCERAKKKGVPTQTVFGNEPSDAEMAAAEAVYAGGAGWNAAPANGAASQEPVAAGAGGGGQRPW